MRPPSADSSTVRALLFADIAGNEAANGMRLPYLLQGCNLKAAESSTRDPCQNGARTFPSEVELEFLTGEQPEAQRRELQAVAARIAAGDRAAEEELIAHFSPRVRVFIASRAAGRDFAEEVLQDSMMALVSNLREGRLREPGRLSALAYGIARNRLADAIRKKARDRTISFPKDFDTPALSTEQAPELVSAARTQIATLEPVDRRILWMTLIDGFKPAEVAAATGMSPEVVRQRKSRALKKLVEYLKPLSRIGRGARLHRETPT